jgi:signal transduction histidine kinase/streptogramin lyase
LAQPQTAKLQVSHDFWSAKEGAPEVVSAIAQTADGFLWLGSTAGLVRFDGSRFEPFRSVRGDQLLSSNVTALYTPRSGGLWVGYQFGGFSFLSNGNVTNYGSELGSPTGSVKSFVQDVEGTVWAGTTSGLWRFDQRGWRRLGVEWSVPVGEIDRVGLDSKGILWGLARVSDSLQVIYLLPGSRRFRTAFSVPAIAAQGGFLIDASGTIVTHSQGQGSAPTGTVKTSDDPPQYPVIPGTTIALIDRTHSVWLDSPDPNDTTLRRLPPSGKPDDELSLAATGDAEVYRINPLGASPLIDREGNVWFGAPQGVHRFSYSPLIRADAGTEEWQFAVAAADDGAVWLGSQGGVQRNSHGKLDPFKDLHSQLNFMFAAPDKTVWFATQRDLWHLVGSNWHHVDLPESMVHQARYLQTITPDRDGGMWISFGRHGLYRLAAGVWTPYGGREDLPKTGVVIEFTDNVGRVWFGYTNNQVAVLEGGRVQVFGPREGIRVGNVTAIQGRGSAVWIGGEFGLQGFDHGRFHSIEAVDDEWFRGISGIVETASGDLWLYGLSGICQIRQAEMARALQDPAYRVHGRHFSRRQGTPGVPAQLRPLPSAIEGSDGKLWFAGSSGVVWLDPAVPEDARQPPPITIQSASADDRLYPLEQPLQFPAHTADVQFTYAAVSLSHPDAIRYRYKLEETDRGWHEVREATPVNYRNLSPGSYHFSVSATDTAGVWSDKVATAAFTILPAFYQTRWFLVLCIAAVLGALYFIYLLRVRHLAREFHLTLEARVSERTRIARDLHDTLLQSFHGLLLQFQTAYKLLPARPTEAKQNLGNAIESAFEAITEGRDAVQGLRTSSAAQGDDLAAAIKTLGQELAAQGTEHSAVRLRVEVEGTPQTLQPLVRDETYRIAGEALRNAFHHARATQIEVDLWYDERRLRLRVRDDGAGIEAKYLREEGQAGHYGIAGMRERANLMGGTLAIWTAPNSGTEVELTIPASRAYVTPPSVRKRWLMQKVFGLRTQTES